MLKAYLDSFAFITACLYKDHYYGNSNSFNLRDENNEYHKLEILSKQDCGEYVEYKLAIKDDYIARKVYLIEEHGLTAILTSRYITQLKQFEDKYFYDGKLGVEYKNAEYIFRLWAPTAAKSYLKIGDNIYETTRKGNIFEYKTKEKVVGKEYEYILDFNDYLINTIDPYAIKLNAIKTKGIIANYEKIKKHKLNNLTDNEVLIYETNIKDITYTDKYSKKPFRDFIENEKILCNIDYLKRLKVTHLELLPIQGISSIDASAAEVKYNWGYDPFTYFAIDPSFDEVDPLLALQAVVCRLNTDGIKIIFDVVYNHVYKVVDSPLHKTVPYYYFRYDNNNILSVHTGCGNDINTSKKMMSKMILDSIKYYIEYFGADGFRFDLLGLIDIETIRNIIDLCKKQSILLLGEGWNMYSDSKEQLATIQNQALIPEMHYFNDHLRDGLYYFANNPEPHNITNLLYDHNYIPVSQSINYVECHDGYTLYDHYLKDGNTSAQALQKVAIINCLLLIIPGITFIHRGQEFGHTKQMNSNTYNASHEINSFPTKLNKKQMTMIQSFIKMLEFKKSVVNIINQVNYQDCYEGLFTLVYNNGKKLVVNISNNPREYLETTYKQINIICGEVNHSQVASYSIVEILN